MDIQNECGHDARFVDSSDEGTSHCVYCRALAAEADMALLNRLLEMAARKLAAIAEIVGE